MICLVSTVCQCHLFLVPCRIKVVHWILGFRTRDGAIRWKPDCEGFRGFAVTSERQRGRRRGNGARRPPLVPPPSPMLPPAAVRSRRICCAPDTVDAPRLPKRYMHETRDSCYIQSRCKQIAVGSYWISFSETLVNSSTYKFLCVFKVLSVSCWQLEVHQTYGWPGG